MRTCRLCGTRYQRLHTWTECSEAARVAEQKVRTEDARRRFTDQARAILAR